MKSLFNKKASLNLSVQAIVIVVIAFVVLGLGLGFVRGQFEQMESTSSSVQEQISQQILEDLRTGNKKLSFPATSLSLETNELDVQAIGVKNTEDQAKNIKIRFYVKTDEACTGASTEGTPYDGFVQFDSQTELSCGTGDTAFDSKIDWDDTIQLLTQGESKVYPISITAPSSTDNYLFKIALWEVDDTGVEIGEFDTKTFFIRTT